jgi:hypothetical protein
MFLIGSGDELCGPLPVLSQAAAYHPPAVSLSAFPAFVYWKFSQISAPCSSPLLWCAFSKSVPLLCVSFHFLVYCSGFFLGGGQCAQGVMLVYPRGGCGKILWHLVLTCWIAKCLPCRFGASLPFCFLIVMWDGETFHRLGGLGCWSFGSPCCFISAKCGSSVSARFWNHKPHAVSFCALVTILKITISYDFLIMKLKVNFYFVFSNCFSSLLILLYDFLLLSSTIEEKEGTHIIWS